MIDALNENGESIKNIVQRHFDFRPAAIIERLDLRRPIFAKTAAYGHFTKSDLPWEQIIVLDVP